MHCLRSAPRLLLALSLIIKGSTAQGHPDATEDVLQEPIQDDTPKPVPDDWTCQDPPYKVMLISSSPLIIYIQDFLTSEERSHLRAVTNNTFRASAIAGTHGASQAAIRTSQSTYLPPTDPVLQCISRRALSFQGASTPATHLEPPQLVRYSAGGEHFYKAHTDWFTDPRQWEEGVVFRPVEGNAVFWENLREVDGGLGGGLVGDERTVHAGLPLTSGEKIGMNIWTREAELGEEARRVEGYPEL